MPLDYTLAKRDGTDAVDYTVVGSVPTLKGQCIDKTDPISLDDLEPGQSRGGFGIDSGSVDRNGAPKLNCFQDTDPETLPSLTGVMELNENPMSRVPLPPESGQTLADRKAGLLRLAWTDLADTTHVATVDYWGRNVPFDGSTPDFASAVSVKLPWGLKVIPEGYFIFLHYWYVSIPTTVESIREKAFYGCKSLRSIILPEGVKRIWKWAFAECTLLHSVSFPNTLVAISPGAFNGCTSLEAVNVSPKTSFSNVDYAASFPSTTNVYQRSKGKRGRGDDEGAGPQQHTKGSLVDWTAPTHAKPANRTRVLPSRHAFCAHA